MRTAGERKLEPNHAMTNVLPRVLIQDGLLILIFMAVLIGMNVAFSQTR